MSRINLVSPANATDEQQQLFSAIEAQLGQVPNFLKVFANSPSALRAFLGLFSIAGEGSLEPQTRERIALAIAQKNSCQYCLSAHTALAGGAGLDAEEIAVNRAGSSQDDKAAVAVRFATALNEHNGEVTNQELDQMRDAGYSDAEIVEVITHVGLNIMTNILGKASRVEIDFPTVELS